MLSAHQVLHSLFLVKAGECDDFLESKWTSNFQKKVTIVRFKYERKCKFYNFNYKPAYQVPCIFYCVVSREEAIKFSRFAINLT